MISSPVQAQTRASKVQHDWTQDAAETSGSDTPQSGWVVFTVLTLGAALVGYLSVLL